MHTGAAKSASMPVDEAPGPQFCSCVGYCTCILQDKETVSLVEHFKGISMQGDHDETDSKAGG